MKRQMRWIGAAGAACALVLSACGGGSDGGSAPPPAPTPTAAITLANEDAVARAAVNGLIGGGSGAAELGAYSSGAQVVASAATGGTASTSGVALSRSASAMTIARQVTQQALQRATAGLAPKTMADGQVWIQAVPPQTEICPGGGQVTVSVDDRDNSNNVSVGDVITIAYANCVGDGVTANGSATLSVGGVTQTPALAQFTLTTTFNNLTAVGPECTLTINGGVATTITRTSTTVSVSMTVLATGFTVRAMGSGYDESVTLHGGLNVSASYNPTAMITTTTYNGAISPTAIGAGTIVVSTPVAFQTRDADAHPYTGELRVQGTTGVLVLRAVSATLVQLQVDRDGNGTWDRDVTVPWTMLI